MRAMCVWGTCIQIVCRTVSKMDKDLKLIQLFLLFTITLSRVKTRVKARDLCDEVLTVQRRQNLLFQHQIIEKASHYILYSVHYTFRQGNRLSPPHCTPWVAACIIFLLHADFLPYTVMTFESHTVKNVFLLKKHAKNVFSECSVSLSLCPSPPLLNVFGRN